MNQAAVRASATPPFAWAARLPVALPVAIAVVLLLMLNPLGYTGGGRDDWHYLEAARCIAAKGWCVPSDHWSARWPLVLPMGGVLALVGESRWSVSLVPIAYGTAALFLLVSLVERHVGRTQALLAGLLCAALPSFGTAFTRPNVDLPELAWLLGGVALLGNAADSRRVAAAGAVFALAIETRPTAVVPALVVAVVILIATRSLSRTLLFVGGIGAGLAASLACHRLLSNDWLIAWRLAAGHIRLPSSELPSAIALSANPLLNPQVIGAWAPAAGIDAHWTVRGLVNLLFHPAMGLTLVAPALLFAAAGPAVRRSRQGRICLALFAAGAAIFAGLTYVLAIDPKPRMFLSLAAMAITATAILAVRLWPHMKLLPALCVAGPLLIGVAYRINVPDTRDLDAAAIRLADPSLAVEDWTGQILTLSPAVRHLPRYTGAENRILAIGLGRCGATLSPLGSGHWSSERAIAINERAPIPVLAWAGAIFGPREILMLCVLRRT